MANFSQQYSDKHLLRKHPDSAGKISMNQETQILLLKNSFLKIKQNVNGF